MACGRSLSPVALPPAERDVRELRAVLARNGIAADVESAERLQSASNGVYRVGDVVVRLPSRSRVGVDRAAERSNMRLAADRGLAPELLGWSDDGALVTQRLPGAALRPDDGDTLAAEVGALLRSVHEGSGFAGTHDPWQMSERLAARGATDATCDQLAAVLAPLRFAAAQRAPCHGDPWPGNIVRDGTRLYLVDWEYSGMGDPLWDVADFATECDLDEAAEVRLVRAYLGRVPDSPTLHRVRVYRCLSDLLWARWSLEEHAQANDTDDFVAEARRRAERGLQASRQLGDG